MVQLVVGAIRGHTEKEINEKRNSLQTERALHVNEAFGNIKSIKLFGWEAKFLATIEAIYRRELELDEKILLRNKFYEFFNAVIQSVTRLATFAVYAWLGHTLTLSQLVLTTVMLIRVKD